MSQEDQTERGLSSFANEIEDIKLILESPKQNYLALLDEFGKRY